MSERLDLSGIGGNDLSFSFALTAAGSPVNLTGLTLTVVLKPTAASPDVTGTTYTTSSGLTVTSAAGGAFTWAVPHADVKVSPPGSLWYRVDLTSAGETETALYGALSLAAA